MLLVIPLRAPGFAQGLLSGASGLQHCGLPCEGSPELSAGVNPQVREEGGISDKGGVCDEHLLHLVIQTGQFRKTWQISESGQGRDGPLEGKRRELEERMSDGGWGTRGSPV